MAISKKGKRKIVVNSKTYIWWAYNEYDQTTFDGNQIKIVTEDQSVCFGYGLEQGNDERIVALSFYRDKGIIHITCPKFENGSGIITPSGISELIKWGSIKSKDDMTRKITRGYFKTDLNEEQANLLYLKILDEINKE